MEWTFKNGGRLRFTRLEPRSRVRDRWAGLCDSATRPFLICDPPMSRAQYRAAAGNLRLEALLGHYTGGEQC